MACIPVPPIPFPVFPGRFSIAPPALPPVPYPAGVCCQIIPLSAVTPPLIVNPAFIAALTAGMKVV